MVPIEKSEFVLGIGVRPRAKSASFATRIAGIGVETMAALSIVVPNDANAHNHLPALQAAAQAISETLAQQRGR